MEFEDLRHLYYFQRHFVCMEGFLPFWDIRFQDGNGNGNGNGEGPGSGEGTTSGPIGTDADGNLGFNGIDFGGMMGEMGPTPEPATPSTEPDLADTMAQITPITETITEGRPGKVAVPLGMTETGKTIVDISNFLGAYIITPIAGMFTYGLASLGLTVAAKGIEAFAHETPGKLMVDQAGNLVQGNLTMPGVSIGMPSALSTPSPTPSGTPSPTTGGAYGGARGEQPLTSIIYPGYSFSPEEIIKQIEAQPEVSPVSTTPTLTVQPLSYSMSLTDVIDRAKFNISSQAQEEQASQEAQKASMGSFLGILLIVGVALTFFFKRGVSA